MKSITISGEAECGDRMAIKELADGVLVAVIDGLGHGHDAAIAAEKVVIAIERTAEQELVSIIRHCHGILSGDRGAVMSLVKLGNNGILAWLGIGNVEVKLLRSQITPMRTTESPLITAGLLGHGILPAVQPACVAVARNDLLFMATDGIKSGFIDEIDIKAEADEIADDIISRYIKKTDDALIFVGRCHA